MKDRVQEIQRNTFAVVSVGCLLVLAFVTLFNTYRMLLLEAEVDELRQNLVKCNPGKPLDDDSLYAEKLTQYITRKRRNIQNVDITSTTSERTEHQTENSFRYRHPSNFKGISASDLPGSHSSLYSFSPNQKGGVVKRSHDNEGTTKMIQFDGVLNSGLLVRKPAERSVDRSYTPNDYYAGSPEAEFRTEEVITRRTRPRMQHLDGKHPRSGRIKPLPSVHLSGDTSKYVLGTHHNYNGDGHIRHLQRTYKDWRPSNWVEKTEVMNSHFSLDDGFLTVRDSGLYLIYAQTTDQLSFAHRPCAGMNAASQAEILELVKRLQDISVHYGLNINYSKTKIIIIDMEHNYPKIYYLDVHDWNGYSIYRNDNIVLQCSVSSHTGGHQRRNTCYTAGVEYIADGDKISLKDGYNERYTVFEPGKSFFGVVKLGDVRGRV